MEQKEYLDYGFRLSYELVYGTQTKTFWGFQSPIY